jgi:hypothetical protein
MLHIGDAREWSMSEQKPINWPDDVALPTREEAEEAARMVDEDIREAAKRRKGKLLRSDPEMMTTVISI